MPINLFKNRPSQDFESSYLRPDNTRLVDLALRYRGLSIPPVQPSVWTRDYVNAEVSLQNFRGDCAYVWQQRDGNEETHYVITALYLQSIDTLNLFDHLREDDSFGVRVYNYNDKYLLSRDLLDSINEILFLERHLAISKIAGLTLLDIGAGYGRLAHRIACALPKLGKIFCVDAIPESTFISEFYLLYRRVSEKALVVPIDKIEATLKKNTVLLATNIHCFSECRLESIIWWIDLLKRYSVRYLMVEPNASTHGGTKLLSSEPDSSSIDYLPWIESRGYSLVVKEPSYNNSTVQRLGVSPTYYYLFELTR